jgi:hypothetical protein
MTAEAAGEIKEPSLAELARVITVGLGIEANGKRGKGAVGMDAYQVRTWQGWQHHIALSLTAVWFLSSATHRGQQWTPALTRPQGRYGLSVLLLAVFCIPGIDSNLPPSLDSGPILVIVAREISCAVPVRHVVADRHWW